MIQVPGITTTPTLGFQDVLSVTHSSFGGFDEPQGNKKYRLLQYLKLGISVVAIAAVLIALSAVSIARSLNGISVSGRLTEYVKLGNLINALQEEREISCVYLGARK